MVAIRSIVSFDIYRILTYWLKENEKNRGQTD